MKFALPQGRHALIVPAMLLLLTFLYRNTQVVQIQEHNRIVEDLRQLKQADAELDLDLFSLRFDLLHHYDTVVNSVARLRACFTDLDRRLKRIYPESSDDLRQALQIYARILTQKQISVEQFKSANAVLQNSLNFFPVACSDVQRALHAGRAPEQLLQSVDQLQRDVLMYHLTGDEARIASLRASFKRLVRDAAHCPAAAREAMEILLNHTAAIVRYQGQANALLTTLITLPGFEANDKTYEAYRRLYERALQRTNIYRTFLYLTCIVLAASILWMVMQLQAHAVALRAANETLDQRVQERTRQLQHAQAELVTTARQAGMAEIATNVLHNVGNVLNSVNVAANLVRQKVRQSKAGGLTKVTQLLKEHSHDLGDFLTQDAKGKQLPGYLDKLAEALSTEQQSIVEELDCLSRSIDHIKDIVSTQQSYAGASSMVEPAQIKDLVEDALRMNASALTRHEVSVIKELAETPLLPLDKHRILLILVNLISNAKYATDGITERPHQIRLTVEMATGQALTIRVADNGMGIPEENLTRIFAHGFTTRKEGHGFGLHSCALAAREMGGELTVTSEGVGKGATFTLEIPLPADAETRLPGEARKAA